MSRRLSVGIDLGTSNACVYYQYLQPQCDRLSIDGSNALVPSIVSYGDVKPVIGNVAKDHLNYKISGVGHKKNTVIRNSKRVLGIKYRKDLLAIKESLCFAKTEQGSDGFVEFVSDDDTKRFTPVDVASDILRFLCEEAQKRGGKFIDSLVVTVPARFNYRQILFTYDAIKRAFDKRTKVLLIDEPTAAAIASNILLQDKDTTFIVYDLGGGTFDLSILRYSENSIRCLKTSGDDSIGGVLFDEELRKYVQKDEKWIEFINNQDPKHVKGFNEMLLSQCTQAKEQLSQATSAHIVVGNGDFEFPLQRSIFENVIKGIVQRTINIMNQAIVDAGLKRDDIDQVILVGGSTRTLLVQEMIKKNFDGRDIVMHTLDPWCCVAHGACMISRAWEQSDFNEYEININGKRFVLDIDLDGIFRTDQSSQSNALPDTLSLSSSTLTLDKRPESIRFPTLPLKADKRPESLRSPASTLTMDKRPESLRFPNMYLSLEGRPTSVRFSERTIDQLKALCRDHSAISHF